MTLKEVICPDCGGVVGGKPGQGRQVCTCFNEPLTESFTPTVTPGAEPVPVVEKICRICGKDLAGHRRLKDSLGYLCLDCARKLRDSQEAGLVSCGECGKKLKPAGLMDYHGTMICKVCFNDHKELDKFKTPPPKLNVVDEREKRSLKAMIVVASVLGLIMLLSYFGLIGHR